MIGDFYEEECKVWAKETGGDEDEAEEQPSVEPVAVVGDDIKKRKM